MHVRFPQLAMHANRSRDEPAMGLKGHEYLTRGLKLGYTGRESTQNDPGARCISFYIKLKCF